MQQQTMNTTRVNYTDGVHAYTSEDASGLADLCIVVLPTGAHRGRFSSFCRLIAGPLRCSAEHNFSCTTRPMHMS